MTEGFAVKITPRLSDDIKITPLMLSEGAGILRRLIEQGDLTDEQIAIGVYRVMYVMEKRDTA